MAPLCDSMILGHLANSRRQIVINDGVIFMNNAQNHHKWVPKKPSPNGRFMVLGFPHASVFLDSFGCTTVCLSDENTCLNPMMDGRASQTTHNKKSESPPSEYSSTIFTHPKAQKVRCSQYELNIIH